MSWFFSIHLRVYHASQPLIWEYGNVGMFFGLHMCIIRISLEIISISEMFCFECDANNYLKYMHQQCLLLFDCILQIPQANNMQTYL